MTIRVRKVGRPTIFLRFQDIVDDMPRDPTLAPGEWDFSRFIPARSVAPRCFMSRLIDSIERFKGRITWRH